MQFLQKPLATLPSGALYSPKPQVVRDAPQPITLLSGEQAVRILNNATAGADVYRAVLSILAHSGRGLLDQQDAPETAAEAREASKALSKAYKAAFTDAGAKWEPGSTAAQYVSRIAGFVAKGGNITAPNPEKDADGKALPWPEGGIKYVPHKFLSIAARPDADELASKSAKALVRAMAAFLETSNVAMLAAEIEGQNADAERVVAREDFATLAAALANK